MKILKFMISGGREQTNLDICNSDRLFGLVCGTLSAMHICRLKPFVLIHVKKCYDWEFTIMRTRLSEWDFSKLNKLEIVIDAQKYILKYLGSYYINNEGIFNYPRIHNDLDYNLNMRDNLLFRAVYWDLKFSYNKMLEKYQNKMLIK